METPLNVLFLCTGNSARSILAEAFLNSAGGGRFRAFSAGSHPAGTVNPFAIEFLGRIGIDTVGLRSKSWDEFAAPGAPTLDLIFTVCDNAAGETCPLWSGHPITAHWGVPDPATVNGTDDEKRIAFRLAFDRLSMKIRALLNLPIDELHDHPSLKQRLDAIGRVG